MLGTVILPGTALAGLAAHAAALAGTPHLAELTLQAPLVLPPDGSALRLQVTAGPPDPDGHRPLAIHTQPANPGQRTRTRPGPATPPAPPPQPRTTGPGQTGLGLGQHLAPARRRSPSAWTACMTSSPPPDSTTGPPSAA